MANIKSPKHKDLGNQAAPGFTPAVTQALLYLKRLVPTLPEGSALPPTRELAVSAKVSLGTLQTALRELAKEGHIQVTPKRRAHRITLLPNTELATTPPDFAPTWQKLVGQLKTDLPQEFLPGCRLPPRKELCRKFQVGMKTLQRALAQLEKDGFLLTQGRGYQMIRRTPTRGLSTLWLLGTPNWRGELNLNSPITADLVKNLEAQAAEMDLILLPKTLESSRLDALNLRATLKQPGKAPLGVLVLAPIEPIALTPMQLQVDALLRHKIAVALFDENGQFELTPTMKGSSHFKAFCPASFLAGKALADHLWEKGHKRIAFISGQHAQVWSQRRYLGLRNRFLRLPKTEGVELFAFDSIQDKFDTTLALWPDTAAAFRRVVQAYRPADWHHFIGPHFEKRLQLAPTPAWKVGESKAIKTLLLAASTLAQQHLPPTFFGPVNESIFNLCADTAFSALLRPLFAAAQKRIDITAWVCANDLTGLAALESLKEKSKSLSVFGFDNTREAFHAGLSSYDFSLPAAARAMLNALLGQNRSQATSAKQEVEGAWVWRHD